MLFNKSLVLATNNWKVMLKALICQVLILALISALCVLIFGGLVADILRIFASAEWDKLIADTFTSIVSGNFNADEFSLSLQTCLKNTQAAIEAIPTIWNKVEISYFTFICVILLYRMMISFSDVSVGFQLEEFMTSNTERPFSWFIVKKFGDSWRFVSLQMLLTLPLDLLLLIGCVGIFLMLLVVMQLWAIIPTLIIVLVLYSLRQTFFAFWLPSLVTGERNVRQSLTEGVATIPYRFGHVFWKHLVVIFVMTVISTLSVLFIENPILKLVVGTVPDLILFFILKCVNLVEYFEATNSPYFYNKVDVEGTERFNKKLQRKARKNKSK